MWRVMFSPLSAEPCRWVAWRWEVRVGCTFGGTVAGGVVLHNGLSLRHGDSGSHWVGDEPVVRERVKFNLNYTFVN